MTRIRGVVRSDLFDGGQIDLTGERLKPMIGDPVVTWLPSAADSRHAKIISCHMIRAADRVRTDGQCRVYSRRRREEGSIHNKQVAMVEGSAELVQSSLARVATEADRSALMRNGESSHVLLDVDSETDL